MILQPGLTGDWHKDKVTLATVAARAKLGIPPTIYLPTTDLAAKCEAVKEIDRKCGCGFDIHINFGSRHWLGNDVRTGAMKSPVGSEAAWMEETSQLHSMLGQIAGRMWDESWQAVAAGGGKNPLLRAIILEDEWRVKADDPKVLYTSYARPETKEFDAAMLAAIARRWSQRIASLSILGPSHDLICYGRGYNDSWTFNEEHGGNRLDVGRNVYRVGQQAHQLQEYISNQLGSLQKSSTRKFFQSGSHYPTTAWLTIGLGYDASGVWHDDGDELYKPLVSGQVGRLLKGKVDNVVLYRVASEAHLRAFMRGYAGPVTSRVKGSK